MQRFSDQLRRAMLAALKARGMSRYRLAKLVGCSQATLSNLVRGETWVGESLVNAIAKELGLRVSFGASLRSRRN
jgi:transcriptional regulator with XRE-family HTH domain